MRCFQFINLVMKTIKHRIHHLESQIDGVLSKRSPYDNPAITDCHLSRALLIFYAALFSDKRDHMVVLSSVY